jgi:multiple sugar transport system substrate-binding protein
MGSQWLGPNREPAFNSEEGIQAFERFGRLLRLYGPPGSENNGFYEITSIFQQGRAAMYLGDNAQFANIEAPEKSKVIGKVGYALYPKGPKGHPGGTVMVWGLAMPKTGKNEKAAWLFMQWATSRDQVLKVQGEGVGACRESVWNDPKGRVKFPAGLPEIIMESHRIGTPFWNPPMLAVAEARDAIGVAIVTSIQGGDVRAAVNKAAADVKRIIAETEK